ncbi:MAG: hypothetical protein PHI37_03140, partial [Candidatus Gracilibacteria bacterium]|nr:hypothetical protein [Candidatus Gracilibacteria bacterium]
EEELAARQAEIDRRKAEKLSLSIKSGDENLILIYKDLIDKELFIAKDGSAQASIEGLIQANKKYNDRKYGTKPVFPEGTYIDTPVPPYKK